MTSIIAELSVIVTAGVSHPPVETMTDEEKQFLGIAIETTKE